MQNVFGWWLDGAKGVEGRHAAGSEVRPHSAALHESETAATDRSAVESPRLHLVSAGRAKTAISAPAPGKRAAPGAVAEKLPITATTKRFLSFT